MFWGSYLREMFGKRIDIRVAIAIELTKVGSMTPNCVKLITGFSFG